MAQLPGFACVRSLTRAPRFLQVDSILIDEARTPLIISGTADKPSDKYYKARQAVGWTKKVQLWSMAEQKTRAAAAERGPRAGSRSSEAHEGGCHKDKGRAGVWRAPRAARPCLLTAPLPASRPAPVQAAKIAGALARDLHYTVDEKQRNVLLTEEGYEAAEDVLQVSGRRVCSGLQVAETVAM